MMSNINGQRKYHVDEKTGTAEEILLFFPESYLNNKNHPEYYTPLNLEEVICDFIIKEKLGEGGFGSVHLGINKQTGEKVAIKVLEKSRLTRYEDKIRLNREIEILKKVKHPNIVQLFSVIETERQILLIMENIKGQEIYQHILLNKKLSEEEACFYFQQIISGIEYLHKLKIAHRDIKSENIIIEQNTKTIKIIDFGLSNTYGDKENGILTTACGSPFYAPPEMLKGAPYRGGAVDIWSAGVVLFAMICGFLPFDGGENSEVYKKIIDGNYTVPSHVSGQARDLIYKVLNTNPRKRITISQIKNHPWIKLYGNSINLMKGPIFNVGLNIDKYIIPIDEDIVEEIEKKFNLSKVKIRVNILSNKSNDITTLYYLILNQKISSGKQSVSDLKSDLFFNYINDKKNLLSNYKNNLKKAISARKFGNIILENKKENNEENFNNKKINKNDLNVKSHNYIQNKKNNSQIQNFPTQNIKTANYESILTLKQNFINNQKSVDKNIKNNYKINLEINKKNEIGTSPLKKKKSKIKFYNINKIKDTFRLKANNIKTSFDNSISRSTKNQNNKNKLEINNKKVYNDINPRIHSATISPNVPKNNKNNKINKFIKENIDYNNNEMSIESKINKTQMIPNIGYKIDINDNKIPRENKTFTLSNVQKEEQEKKIIIKDYKQQKDNNNYIPNPNKENESIEPKNKNIYINIEEKVDTGENSEKILPFNGDIPPPAPIPIEKNQKIIVNIISDEKTKYVQTLDSLSIPTINQEDYLISSNNNVYKPIQETSFTPKKEEKEERVKNIIYSNKKKVVNKTKLIKKNKKENKVKIYKLAKKKSSVITKSNNNNLDIDMLKNKIKKLSIINSGSLDIKRNYSTQKKSSSIKKLDGNEFKRKKTEINKTEILRNPKKNIKNIKNLKTNNNNLNRENAILITNNNITCFNPIEEYNDIFPTENNYKNFNKKNLKNKNIHKHKKFNSIDTNVKFYQKTDFSNCNSINTNPNTINDDNLKRINTINIHKKINFKKNVINKNKYSSPLISNTNRKNKNKEKSNKDIKQNKNNNKIYLNKNIASSGLLFNRNAIRKTKKTFSDVYTPISSTLKTNILFNIGNIDIKAYKNNNDFLFNSKNYLLNKDKISKTYENIENSESYEPFDLNCIFTFPKKNIKEKILNGAESIKCSIKQINSYKYKIIYGKNNIYGLNLSFLNNITILNFKIIQGINNIEYINNVRKIIQAIYK